MTDTADLKTSERFYMAAMQVIALPAELLSKPKHGVPGNVTAMAWGLFVFIVSALATLPVWLFIAGVGRLIACFEPGVKK
jgi:hypothetical protein